MSMNIIFYFMSDVAVEGLTENFKSLLGLIMGVVFSIVAISGSAYIGWLGLKMAKAEDETQRMEMKKNMAWKIKIFLLIIVLMASFTSIWALTQQFITKGV